MEEWISLRQFAKRIDRSLSAVQKAIKAERVTAIRRDDDGRISAIEFNAAREQWTKNTDPAQVERSGTVPLDAVAGELQLGAEEGKETSLAAASKDPFGYLEHRAKTEQFKSKQAELDYLTAIGLVVPRAGERALKTRRYRALRDKLLGIADRESAVLAAERDPVQVRAILLKAIKQALYELSDDARAESARGVAERMVA